MLRGGSFIGEIALVVMGKEELEARLLSCIARGLGFGW